jgi:hypothetical protein
MRKKLQLLSLNCSPRGLWWYLWNSFDPWTAIGSCLQSNKLIRRSSPTLCWVRLLAWLKQRIETPARTRIAGSRRGKRIREPENYKKAHQNRPKPRMCSSVKEKLLLTL